MNQGTSRTDPLTLLAFPFRFAFFDKGLHAFLLIFRAKQVVKHLLLFIESLGEEGFVRVIDQAFGSADSQWGARGDLFRQFKRLVEIVTDWYDVIYQSVLQCLL